MIRVLILTILTGFAATHLVSPLKAETHKECSREIPETLRVTINELRENMDIKTVEDKCSLAQELVLLEIDQSELTSTTKDGWPAICITDTRSNPCKIFLGNVLNGRDANSILAEITGYRPEVQPLGMIDETYKRLFYKPSKHARHSK